MTFFALSLHFFLQSGAIFFFFKTLKPLAVTLPFFFSLGDMKSEWLQVAGCVNTEDPSVTGWRT